MKTVITESCDDFFFDVFGPTRTDFVSKFLLRMDLKILSEIGIFQMALNRWILNNHISVKINMTMIPYKIRFVKIFSNYGM